MAEIVAEEVGADHVNILMLLMLLLDDLVIVLGAQFCHEMSMCLRAQMSSKLRYHRL